MENKSTPLPSEKVPRWDYAALPAILLVCLMIPIAGIILESTRPVSPCNLVDDPRTTHLRIYQDGKLRGMQTWEGIINITIVSQSNLELWYFHKYCFGYSNWDSFIKPSTLSLKYSTDADYKDYDNWEYIADENGDPVHPVKANDGEVKGFYYNLSLYVKSGYIENWGNSTNIYLAIIERGNYRITNPNSPIQILYSPQLGVKYDNELSRGYSGR